VLDRHNLVAEKKRRRTTRRDDANRAAPGLAARVFELPDEPQRVTRWRTHRGATRQRRAERLVQRGPRRRVSTLVQTRRADTEQLKPRLNGALTKIDVKTRLVRIRRAGGAKGPIGIERVGLTRRGRKRSCQREGLELGEKRLRARRA
jgi:hypothetical protein